MTTTVIPIEVCDQSAPVPYTALIGDTETLVRYQSVIDPSEHFDVLRLPHGGEPEWVGSWGWLWSTKTRASLVDHVRAVAAAHTS